MKTNFQDTPALTLAVSIWASKASPLATDDERELWLHTFARVYDETNDAFKAEAAAEGALKRLGLAMAVKAIDGDPIIGGWAIMYGSPVVKDRANPKTYFDNQTEFLPEYYETAPLWINHEDGRRIVGQRCGTEIFPGHGVWLNHRVFRTGKNSEYFNDLKPIIDANQATYSTDSFHHYVNEGYRKADGYLSQWPLAGCSLIIGIPEAEPGLGPVRFIDPLAVAAGRSAVFSQAVSQPVAGDRATPVEAQKAQDSENETLNPIGETKMDKEQLRQMLITALQLAPETTLEEIVAMLQQAIGATEEAPAEGEVAAEMSTPSPIDMASVRSAAGLPDDAPLDAVKAAIASIITLAQSFEPIQVNQEAMAKVFEMTAAAVKAAPVIPAKAPYTVGAAKSSQRYGSINVSRNAPAPSVGAAIKAILNGDRKAIAANTKAQGVTENTLGGYFLRDEIASEILKPVYNDSSIMNAGVTRRTMTTETLTVRKNRGGSVAYWAGEHLTVNQSDITVGQVDLVLKELVAENRQSRKALTYAEDLEQEIRDDLSMQMALALDLSALRGTGAKPAAAGNSGAEPLGIRNALPTAQVTTLGSGNGAAPALSNINKMIANIKGRNFKMTNRWGLITSTREAQFLSGLTTTTGEPILRENWSGVFTERVLGVPTYESNQVPTNITLGTSTDTSELYLGDWQYAVVGIGKDVELVVDESVYRRERDVLIQAVMYADFGIFFREAFEVLAGVRGIIT